MLSIVRLFPMPGIKNMPIGTLLAFDAEKRSDKEKAGRGAGELLIVSKAKSHSLQLNLLGG